MRLSPLLLPFLLFALIDAKGSPPSLKPTWIREKEQRMIESKLSPPPRVSFLPRPSIKRPPLPTPSLPRPLLFHAPTHTKTRASANAKRSTVAPVVHSVTPPSTTTSTVQSPTTTSTPLPFPFIPREGMTLRSFEKIIFENGRHMRIRVKDEMIFKGKVVETRKARTKRDIVRRAISSPSVQHFVSKDGSTVVTTSSGDSDEILVVMQDTAPATTSIFTNADRKMKKTYEDALDGVKEIFDEIGSNLVRDIPNAGEAFETAKKELGKKMEEWKEEGGKTRNGAVKKAIELAATTDDQTVETMKEGMKDYLVYDNSVVMMDGLLYSMPLVYNIVQSASTPIQNSVNQMHGAVVNYVSESLSGLRDKMPPLTKTTEDIEKTMKKLLNDLTEKTNKKISGMISYETLDAINEMNPTETQSVSVIQTGPGFSYVTLSSSAPSFSKSLNGTEERAKCAVDEYRKELEPYVNGKMLSPQIFGNVPAHEEKTKSLNELLDKLSHEVDDYLHKGHPKSSVEAAKAVQKNPEEKEKLNEAMENATMYSYVPMLYNGWYTLAPVSFTQASDLATATSNQLNAYKGQAVNYAYSLLMDIFGGYQLALLPIQQAVSNMTETGSNIDSKLHETLPFAIAQATTEMPKDKKTALQQIVYYYMPSYPFFG